MTDLVHCLVCEHVYEESKPVLRDRCPQCGNTDMEQTVYLIPKPKHQEYDEND
jgi:predicted  nucleic acid-binding Zn-ribbon protein